MPEKVLLKRYASRRLYDTERKSYITLNQVSDLIRAGRQVQVLDAKTEEDLTAFILTQIMVEEARNRNSLLPVSLLHLFIQYGQNILSEFFEEYLELIIRNYLAQKAALDQNFKSWLDMGKNLYAHTASPLPPFAPLTSLFDAFQKPGEGSEKEPPVQK